MKTKHTVTGLLLQLLAPAVSAYEAETGKTLDAGALVKSVRVTVAGWLRSLANMISPEPKAEAKPEPVAVEVVPVVPAEEAPTVQPVVTATPDIITPNLIADAKPVEQPAPVKTARKPRSKPTAKPKAAKKPAAKGKATKAKPVNYRERVKAERTASKPAKRKTAAKA